MARKGEDTFSDKFQLHRLLPEGERHLLVIIPRGG